KQTTTMGIRELLILLLYKKSSNSHLKANHNGAAAMSTIESTLQKIVKLTFESKPQLRVTDYYSELTLQKIVKLIPSPREKQTTTSG
ncbi:MAG TPA: hypothetical protein VN514_00910, partial [Ignavibacteria bacterium]|nr:hypothetical protein [Ignavibacteria bacterium]